LFLPSEYSVQSIAPAEALSRAERAARQALALDDRLAAAHTALAEILAKQGLVEEAEESFRRAIASDQRYPTAHQWYATRLVNAGRTAEGLAQIREAVRMDPLSLVILTELGEVLEADGQLEAATEAYEGLIELYPDAYLTHFFAGVHMLKVGDFDRAGDLLGQYVASETGSGAEGERARDGIRDPSQRLETLRAIAAADRIEFLVASALMQGDEEGAVVALERAVEGPRFESIYMAHVLAILGPEVAAQPRVRAAVDRWGARLRERYGVRE
jgi:tetratricopeptide (TPR) repeat protein